MSAQGIRTGLSGLREVIKITWTDAAPFVKLRLAGVLLLVICASVVSALTPLFLKWIIDAFSNHKPHASLVILIALYVPSMWSVRVVGEVRGFIYARAEQRMFRTLTERLFSHVISLPLRFHLNRETGAITQTMENAVRGYEM